MTSETTDNGQAEPKRRTGPFNFFKEVRAEGRKVTWATRQEVTVSAIMVLIMVTLAMIFFWIADLAIGYGVRYILDMNT